MLIPRPEKKVHGTKNLIEGKFQSGQTVSLIEDIITTGKSADNVKRVLNEQGLNVIQTICFLAYFPKKCPNVTYLTSLERVLNVLSPYISKNTRFNILQSFRFRAPTCLTLYPPHLREYVAKKKSQLIIALDDTWDKVKKLIPLLAPYVCAFKFHYDILYQTGYGDFEPRKLMAFAKQYHFLVIRDRKYGDVAKTNKLISGPTGRNQHINIVHMISGTSALPKGPVIVVLDMSTADNLFTPDYINSVICQTKHLPNVLGYVSQHKWWNVDSKLCFTPGITLDKQRVETRTAQIYSTPENKRKDGADLFIVGSAIVKSDDPVSEARRYRDATWNPDVDKVGKYYYDS